jgi:hypothetical protein
VTRPAALPTALLLAAALLAAPGPTLAQARMNEQLAPGTAPPPVVVYLARRIHTLEPANPSATAVAVAGRRIVIDQHLHPLLGALCLSTEVIAPEDWILPDRTFPSARSPAEYMARLRAAEADMKDEQAWLFSWGYHALWHGKLDRKAPSSRSSCR